MNAKFISLVKNQIASELRNTVETINKSERMDEWHLKALIPNGKSFKGWDLTTKKDYYVKRAKLRADKQKEQLLKRVELLKNAPSIERIDISIEWKKSATWGSNPHCSIWVIFAGNINREREYFESSASGCGYDKESTVIASALNQCNAFIALLFKVEKKDPQHKVYGYYGTDKGFFPRLSGGVGTNCYPAIFALVGYKMQKVASGKTFDSWSITKN